MLQKFSFNDDKNTLTSNFGIEMTLPLEWSNALFVAFELADDLNLQTAIRNYRRAMCREKEMIEVVDWFRRAFGLTDGLRLRNVFYAASFGADDQQNENTRWILEAMLDCENNTKQTEEEYQKYLKGIEERDSKEDYRCPYCKERTTQGGFCNNCEL